MESPTLNRSIHFKLPTGVLGAALSDDGQRLLCGCMDGAYSADLAEQSYEKVGEHGSYVSSVAWLGDMQTAVSAGYDGVVKWLDVHSKLTLREIPLHNFWSWDMAVSPDRTLLASVTGQYLAGGYKYEPLPEREPSVKVVSSATGEVVQQLEHVPSVQAVAFSRDNRYVAAGNLMGEVRIWEIQTGTQVAGWTTGDFTSWGIIKSHSYLGGIFSMRFTPDGEELILAGMGPMRDPMAGNGKQLWQKWSWQEDAPRKVNETNPDQAGEGLMEALAVHPDLPYFAMGGRLRGGDWNVALFDLASGERRSTLKTGYRVTEAIFSEDGRRLVLVGAQGQPGPDKQGHIPDFGRIEVYDIQ